jgi:preprotein translocase subunit SecY
MFPTLMRMLRRNISLCASRSLLLGGTSLSIAVSVTMDTTAQIQSHLIAHHYEGLIRKARLRQATRS